MKNNPVDGVKFQSLMLKIIFFICLWYIFSNPNSIKFWDDFERGLFGLSPATK
ncbi:hypothetical protein SAMN06265349_102195 [Flavobacterium resistens]|uniref:Uncharacterized protein n=1 Tax=Flavobacterium resistens TaxID=443612 RepID=A0A521C704_9FLAO|nr:hypothetical protein SAMN06265349_102195 [Flavobacterium resistens]